MRRLQAEIRVYPKNEKPKCASEDEELVQVMRLNAALHNQYLLLILMF
jgi:hypothetical protein